MNHICDPDFRRFLRALEMIANCEKNEKVYNAWLAYAIGLVSR